MSGFAPDPGSTEAAPVPSVGRMLHFNIGHGVWRPLIVVDVNPEFPYQIKGTIETLLEDQINVDLLPKGTTTVKLDRGTRWQVQCVIGTEFGAWRWPPRV